MTHSDQPAADAVMADPEDVADLIERLWVAYEIECSGERIPARIRRDLFSSAATALTKANPS